MGEMGNMASIVTLLLFVFYLIGRAWALVKDSKYQKIDATVDFDHSIDHYDTFDIDLHGNEVIIVSFNQNIRRFSIWEIKWNDEYNRYKKRKKTSEIEYVPSGKEITICTIVPEGIPQQLIEFECTSGICGEVLIGYDGRNNGNGISSEGIKVRKTLKAWLYYLVR